MKPSGKIWIGLLVTFAAISAYTFLHEVGHAAAALAQGGRLTAFSINFFDFSAHAGYAGDFSPARTALIGLSGAVLPLLVWVVVMAATARRSNPVAEWLKFISTMIVAGSLLAWVILPFFYLAGNPPAGDDVTRFLRGSGMPPLLLAALSSAAIAGIWTRYARQSGGLRAALQLVRDPQPWDPAQVRRPLTTVGVVTALIWMVSLGLNLVLPGDAGGPPRDYVQAAQVDLSQTVQQDAIVVEFHLDAPGGPGLFVEVRDINTRYFDLRLTGPDGYEQVVLHGESYFTNRDTVWLPPDEALAPGDYRLVLNSQPSPGVLSIYLQPVQ